MKNNLKFMFHFICMFLLFSSCNNVQVEFKQIDKSRTTTTYTYSGDPEKIMTQNKELLADFSNFHMIPLHLNVYFYVENKGENCKIPIKINYTSKDEFNIDKGIDAQDEKTVDAQLLKSKLYQIKVSLKLGLATRSLNKVEITLPKGNKDDYSVKLKGFGRGAISNVEIIELVSSEDNLKQGQKFLEENKKVKGVVTLTSGLQYIVLKEGKGAKPVITNTVTVHHVGSTIDGKVFDSSVERGVPVSFPLNDMIKGWQEALQLMQVGSKWKVFVPSSLAFGEKGAGDMIAPHSVLIFEIELISIKTK